MRRPCMPMACWLFRTSCSPLPRVLGTTRPSVTAATRQHQPGPGAGTGHGPGAPSSLPAFRHPRPVLGRRAAMLRGVLLLYHAASPRSTLGTREN